MPISLIIADDHAFTLQGMQRTLQQRPEFSVLGATSSGVEAIAMTRRFKPDLAVVDFAMPDANGLDVFTEIARWSPATRTVIVTGSESTATITALVSAGVHGIFLKTQAPRDICAGLLRVAGGDTVHGQPVRALLDRIAATNPISERERQVLIGISRGLSNPGIARELSISPKTVESHRASLMRKLEVHSTAALIVRAMRDGLFDL